jgi:aromatic ring hydroxylase
MTNLDLNRGGQAAFMEAYGALHASKPKTPVYTAEEDFREQINQFKKYEQTKADIAAMHKEIMKI